MGVGTTPAKQRAYVKRLAEAGLAGLGFGLGFSHDKTPKRADHGREPGRLPAVRGAVPGAVHRDHRGDLHAHRRRAVRHPAARRRRRARAHPCGDGRGRASRGSPRSLADVDRRGGRCCSTCTGCRSPPPAGRRACAPSASGTSSGLAARGHVLLRHARRPRSPHLGPAGGRAGPRRGVPRGRQARAAEPARPDRGRSRALASSRSSSRSPGRSPTPQRRLQGDFFDELARGDAPAGRRRPGARSVRLRPRRAASWCSSIEGGEPEALARRSSTRRPLARRGRVPRLGARRGRPRAAARRPGRPISRSCSTALGATGRGPSSAPASGSPVAADEVGRIAARGPVRAAGVPARGMDTRRVRRPRHVPAAALDGRPRRAPSVRRLDAGVRSTPTTATTTASCWSRSRRSSQHNARWETAAAAAVRAPAHAALPDAQGRGAHGPRSLEQLRPHGVLARAAGARPAGGPDRRLTPGTPSVVRDVQRRAGVPAASGRVVRSRPERGILAA